MKNGLMIGFKFMRSD